MNDLYFTTKNKKGLQGINNSRQAYIFAIKPIKKSKIPLFWQQKNHNTDIFRINIMVSLWSEWRDLPFLRKRVCEYRRFRWKMKPIFQRWAAVEKYKGQAKLRSIFRVPQSWVRLWQSTGLSFTTEPSSPAHKKQIQNKSPVSVFGRSGGTWTHGILLPKQARYQLRYTPIVLFIFAYWNILPKKCGFVKAFGDK